MVQHQGSLSKPRARWATKCGIRCSALRSRTWTSGFFKPFHIREFLRLQFRSEGFNLTNTANFAEPRATLGAANFGIISAATPASTLCESQFALKLLF
jgi:hypothetical protein